jgi:hypothetical protein
LLSGSRMVVGEVTVHLAKLGHLQPKARKIASADAPTMPVPGDLHRGRANLMPPTIDA